MPLDLGSIAGIRTKFQLYTVPGQIYYKSTRRLVLQGVDGIVFVADSSAGKVEENRESMKDLEENLKEMGRSLKDLPVVIQYNKRDLPDALTVDDLQKQVNPHGLPFFEAVATTGQGVFPTLKALAGMVLEAVNKGGLAAARAPRASQAGSAVAPMPASSNGGAAQIPAPTAAPRALTSPGSAMPAGRVAASSAGGFLEPAAVRLGAGGAQSSFSRRTPPPVPAPRPTSGTGIGGVLPSKQTGAGSHPFAAPLPTPAGGVPPHSSAPTVPPQAAAPQGSATTPTFGRAPALTKPSTPPPPPPARDRSTPPPDSAVVPGGRTRPAGSNGSAPARPVPNTAGPRPAPTPHVSRPTDHRYVRVSGLGRPRGGGGKAVAIAGLLALVAAVAWYALTHLR
jgi:signal recognition particle receptor subunit beta